MARSPAPFDEGVFLMHLHKGKEHFDQNLLQKAREELEAAYHLRPQDEKVQNLLGMTYYKLEMLPEAEEMYVSLTLNNPEIHTLQSNLGLIRLKLDKLDLAEEALGRAMELQPTNAKVHFYLGLLYEKKEQWSDALLHFEQAKNEKMAARIREVIASMQMPGEEGALLPFEVIEVVEESPVAFPRVMNELPAGSQQEEGRKDSEMSTPNEQSQDVMETMETLEHTEEEEEKENERTEKEIDDHGPAMIDQAQWREWVQDPSKFKLREFIDSVKEKSFPEEEPVEDLTPIEEDETENEEVRSSAEYSASESSAPEYSAPSDEATQQFNPNFVSDSVQLEQPFFLADEVAADISTFLAQSRDEEMQDEVFVFDDQEPKTPSLVAITQEVKMPENFEEEPFENRIPTPEEVESLTPVAEIESFPNENEAFKEGVEEVSFTESLEGTIADEAANSELSIPTASDEEEKIIEEPEEESVDFEILDDIAAVVEDAKALSDEAHRNEAHRNEAPEGLEELPSSEVEEAPEAVLESFSEDRLEENEQEIPAIQEAEPDRISEVASAEELSEDLNLASEAIAEVQTEHPVQFVQPSSAESAPESREHTQTLPPSESAGESSGDEIPEVQEGGIPENQELEEIPFSEEEKLPSANLDQFSRDRFYVQPLVGSDRFLLIDPHLLEVIISDQLLCRIGTISSYTGNLDFKTWRESMPLVHVKGSGVLFLADRRKELFLLSLNQEAIFVESNHLLVAQSVLKVEPFHFHHKSGQNSFSMLRVSGRGTLALTCQSRPLTINIQESLPANIPSNAVIAWSGNLHLAILEDTTLRKLLMTPDEENLFLRFTGSGDVVVEQGSLWGDRRNKRT